ncbi:hypothetical protein NQU49_27445, partial [Escherichia coli]|uniref:hypothetical protein n=1 Tax=Escherichia coli TaxID=562 RepID=UPI002118A42E
MEELIHQLKVSSAKFIVTDRERLPVIVEAANAVSIPKESIFLVDADTIPSSIKGCQSLSVLLAHGERQWERIDDLD